MTTTSFGTRIRLSAVVIVGALFLLVGVLAIGRDSTSSDPMQPAALVSSVQDGCLDWSAGVGTGVPDGWCEELAGWMTTHMVAGTGPHVMWSDPAQARDTCVRAAAESEVDTTTRVARCDAMVTWMSGHMSRWTDDEAWPGWLNSALASSSWPLLAARPG